jgi:hypothetical protein
VTFTDSSITVSAASSADIGTVNVQFTVEDATKDPARTNATIGQLQVTIHDVPAQPSPPSAAENGDGSIKVTLSREPANNGKPINDYVIYANGTKVATEKALGTYAIPVTNGKPYSFTVVAENDDGPSTQSAASNSVTTYGTPATPGPPSISETGNAPNGKVSFSWSQPDTKGGLKVYEWKLSDGKTGQTTSTSDSVGGLGQGNYSVQVRVENQGNKWSDWSASSATVNVPNPPPPAKSVSLSRGARIPGPTGTCRTGNCYYYVVDAKNFPANSTVTVTLYCPNELNHHDYTTDGSGSLHINTANTQYKTYCGFDARADVDGTSSPSVNFGN